MTENERTRLVIELKKITYPNGEKLTRSLVPFDINGLAYNPDSDIINDVLPKIDEEYRLLIEKCRHKEISDSLDEFFENVSGIALVGNGLKEVLALDLNKNVSIIEKALSETQWFRSTIEYIRNDFKQAKKTDPIKYAESVRQIVDVFDLKKALTLLNKSEIKIKRSTIAALRRIAGETPKIKRLIREGKLKLTIAFELPNVEEKEREKIAEQIATLESYDKQKRFLKKVK